MRDWDFDKKLQDDIAYLEQNGYLVFPMPTMGVDLGFGYWCLKKGDDAKYMLTDFKIVEIADEHRKGVEVSI